MRKAYIDMVRGQIIRRFQEFGCRCECNYPFHVNHEGSCGTIVKLGYFRPRYGTSRRIATTENTIYVCRTCKQQIDSSLGEIG